MEILSGHEKIITKSGISLNAGTLNQGFTVYHYTSTTHTFPYWPYVVLVTKLTGP
jgi:hypothetical protein